MPERTLIVGSVSKEYRMIGWRIGWIAGPPKVMADVFYTHSYLVIAPPGIAQKGAEVALRAEDAGRAGGAGRVEARGATWCSSSSRGCRSSSPRAAGACCWTRTRWATAPRTRPPSCMSQAKVAATPMTNWGSSVAERYIRLVFSYEPQERLKLLRERLRRTSLLP